MTRRVQVYVTLRYNVGIQWEKRARRSQDRDICVSIKEAVID